MPRLLAALLILAACDPTPVDTAAAVEEYCETAPEVTWENFGASWLQTYNCLTCHGPEDTETCPWPECFPLTTPAQVWAHRDGVLRFVDAPHNMEPDVTLDRARDWMLCGTPGT